MTTYKPDQPDLHTGFDVGQLFDLVNDAVKEATTQMEEIKKKQDKVQIGDMFQMQMLMNHLSQLSEMATNIVSASHSSIMSMTRGVKGQ